MLHQGKIVRLIFIHQKNTHDHGRGESANPQMCSQCNPVRHASWGGGASTQFWRLLYLGPFLLCKNLRACRILLFVATVSANGSFMVPEEFAAESEGRYRPKIAR